jgi:hypothetical protein
MRPQVLDLLSKEERKRIIMEVMQDWYDLDEREG